MPDLTAPCDWHDNDLHLQLPELPDRIEVTLSDKRGREVYSAKAYEYVPKAENAKLRERVDELEELLPENGRWFRAETVEAYVAEIAKLRELAHLEHECNEYSRLCEYCPHSGIDHEHEDFCCGVLIDIERLRGELGMVDE